MTTYDRIKDVLFCYETAGLIEGDTDKVLSFLTDNIIGIGMGEQGFVLSKEEVLDIMLTTVKKDLTAEYSLDIQDVVIHMTTECTANLCAKVYVKRYCQGETTVSGFMQSLSFVLENGSWLICGLHASPIMLSEEAIESYPLRFADSTLAKLKMDLQKDTFELMNKNFSGGIMGIYIKSPYPLYFANDKMIEMLGYEREEFEACFGDSIKNLFHFNQKHVEQLSRSIELGEDFSGRDKWKRKDKTEIWVEVSSRVSEDDKGEPVLISIVTDVTKLVTLQMETERQNRTILSSMRYGSKIQKNLLPSAAAFDKAFTDYGILWSPKDMVGGDIYWLKQFEKGSVLAVSDCTGHGIPGALLTMLVVSVLDNVVRESNCHDTAGILYELDQYMAGVLNSNMKNRDEPVGRITDIKDGCDIAVFYIAKDGSVSISASNMYIFVCDGREVRRIKGQKFYIGEGRLTGREEVKVISAAPDPANRFYVSSDGLFDQVGGERGQPWGFRDVKDMILEHYKDSQKEITEKIWKAFESYRGECGRRDDLQLITFIP